MKAVNVIIVLNETNDKVLMCKRRKDPYKGLYNLVGGKREANESAMEAAYRELYEESSISKEQIVLVHLMDMKYYMDDIQLEVFMGRLHTHVEVSGDENELLWMDRHEDFFDCTRFAGEGNIGHMMMHVDFHDKRL